MIFLFHPEYFVFSSFTSTQSVPVINIRDSGVQECTCKKGQEWSKKKERCLRKRRRGTYAEFVRSVTQIYHKDSG